MAPATATPISEFTHTFRWLISAMPAGSMISAQATTIPMPSQKVTPAITVRLATLAAETPFWE